MHVLALSGILLGFVDEQDLFLPTIRCQLWFSVASYLAIRDFLDLPTCIEDLEPDFRFFGNMIDTRISYAEFGRL